MIPVHGACRQICNKSKKQLARAKEVNEEAKMSIPVAPLQSIISISFYVLIHDFVACLTPPLPCMNIYLSMVVQRKLLTSRKQLFQCTFLHIQLCICDKMLNKPNQEKPT